MNEAPWRTLSVCADDYGLHAGINRGILRLAAQGRLTSVSCMVNAPAWRSGAAPLVALGAPLAAPLETPLTGTMASDHTAVPLRLSLHFNLTQGRPLSEALARHWPRLPGLPRLLWLAHTGQLPDVAVGDELRAQWDCFVQTTGRRPDIIDGHQHVHHLPGVRPWVAALLLEQPGLRVRDSGSVRGPGHAFKRFIIEATGGRALQRQLQKTGRQANTQLRGVYDFSAAHYRRLMQRWLADLPPRGALLFCHPGEPALAAQALVEWPDPIATARVRELAYLSSDEFLADLQSARVRLGQAA